MLVPSNDVIESSRANALDARPSVATMAVMTTAATVPERPSMFSPLVLVRLRGLSCTRSFALLNAHGECYFLAFFLGTQVL